MKTFQWPLRAFLFVSLIQITSCTKNVDNVTTDSVTAEVSNDLTFPTTSEFSTCKLRRIVHEHPRVSESLVNGLFTYNPQGNPVSLIYSTEYNTDNFYFYYDSKRRLKGMLMSIAEDVYSESTELHRYGYDNNNTIVVDTVLHPNWDSGIIGDFIPRATIRLTYDSQGRIIKETIKNLSTGITRNPTYTYDVRGNLAVPSWKSSGYDNKVSIFRTNPVFQFIHRNYSKNNALPEAKYNSRMLPLGLKNLNDEFFGAYKTNPYATPNPFGGIIKAIYDCQ